MTDVYNKYEEKFGTVRLRRTVPQNPTGKKRFAWDEIYDDDSGCSGSGGSSSLLHSTLNLSRDTLLLLCCKLLLLQLLLMLLNLSHT